MASMYYDPNQPLTAKQGLLNALSGIGNSVGAITGNPAMDAASHGGIAGPGNTTEGAKVEGPAIGGGPVPPAAGANTSGLNPNNPIDAIFMKTGYGDRGVGSGFGDLSYWRAHPDQASRLLADQQGTGPDTPGPGDAGNTSHGTGGGGGAPMMGAGMFGGGLSLNPILQGSGTNNIMAALGQLGAGSGGSGIGSPSFLQSLIAALTPSGGQ